MISFDCFSLLVVDVDDAAISSFISFLHSRRRTKKNHFFWPLKEKALCWHCNSFANEIKWNIWNACEQEVVNGILRIEQFKTAESR